MEQLYEDPIFLFFLASLGLLIFIAVAITVYKSYWHFAKESGAKDVAEDLEDIAYKK